MARINIYVPDEMKRRMDDCDANWSAVAQAAFRDELERRKTYPPILDVAAEYLRDEEKPQC